MKICVAVANSMHNQAVEGIAWAKIEKIVKYFKMFKRKCQKIINLLAIQNQTQIVLVPNCSLFRISAQKYEGETIIFLNLSIGNLEEPCSDDLDDTPAKKHGIKDKARKKPNV